MTLRQRRIFWFLVWLLVIFLGPITVLRNIQTEPPQDYVAIINIFQRITGLLAFSLIFAQVMLGSFMGRWLQILGARAYKVHITQGLITYGFIFIHPIFNVIITQQSVGALSSVLSLMPNFSSQREIYLTFGRIAFTLLTIGVIAAYFRTKPIFRRNWRAFHILNYLAFFSNSCAFPRCWYGYKHSSFCMVFLVSSRLGFSFDSLSFLYNFFDKNYSCG